MKPASCLGQICPACGEAKQHRNLLLHHACWDKLPSILQQNFNRAPTLDDRRAAYRAILEHLREQKENPELFPA